MVSAANFSTFLELKSTERLPSPTGVALALLQMVDREDTTMTEIAARVQADPALTGRILRLCNSAQVGRAGRVANVREAVSRLGLHQVRHIALGFSLVTKYAAGACRRFRYQEFWSGSLATGVAAQTIAGLVEPRLAGDAFTAGLLLRVGQLALATVYPDDYAKVLSGWHSQTDKTLCELEQDRFAINNTELTELMLGDWKLPKATVDAVHWHETPQHAGREAVPAQLARILHLAAQFGAICVAPEEERYDLARELVDRGHELDLSGPGLFKLGDDIVRDWKEWSKLLELTPLEAPSFKELAEPRPTTIVDLEAAPSSETSILIVDPGDADRRRLAEHLGTSGRRVLQAENGRAALQVALEEQPSIIITEWRLPEMDGPTLCRALRQNKTGQRMRILMLTAQTGDEQELAAVAAGADAFLAKPFRPKLLEARLLAMQRLIDFNLELEREREENRRIAAELAIANGKLQQAAYTDALTELPNRRFGWERLQQAWQDEPAAPLACLLIDVDHFKRVNDTFGHDVGDAVLQRTAAALRGSARREEALCRWGGEEFFLLCPGATLEGAKKAAERLRGAVAAIRTDKAGAAITTTVSIGVAARQEAMERPDQLVKAADQAVYVAKQAGRNRVSP